MNRNEHGNCTRVACFRHLVDCLFEADHEDGAVHKKNSVSGRPAGWLRKVRLETFFFHFCKNKSFFLKLDNIFMERKKKVEKKKIAAARLASILAIRWTGNRIFFMVSLVLYKETCVEEMQLKSASGAGGKH